MSHRSRGSRVRQHLHCDSCYSRRCRAPVEPSASCALLPCRLLCGAVFHLCKEEEHLLLCPNVRVPCLNAQYGCPVQLPRSSRAAHLQVCPASVVCCSMEWNRWPSNIACSQPHTELLENLLRERERFGCLDLAMALQDQDALFHSIKMKKLFPELIQTAEEEAKEEQRLEEEMKKEKEKKKQAFMEKEAAERAAAKEARDKIWEAVNMINVNFPDEKQDEDEEDYEENQPVLSQAEREAIARASEVDAGLLENYNAWERMFSMEMGGCRESEGTAGAGRGQARGKGRGKSLGSLKEEEEATCDGAAASTSSACSSSLTGKPKKKSFVYGKLEPMKIITVRTFKIPTSFTARQGRIRNPGFYKRENKAVDTSDLGVAPGDMPVWEEVQASLLCSLERERRGHLIAESTSSDSLLMDEGTQTYSFLSAPFRRNTSLADLTAGKPLELHLQLQVESVTSRQNKASSAFTFLCGHTFQRTEYGKHFKNIHSDIQMCVNGWFEQRCPLAYMGCTYSQRRFRPSTYEATVNFNEELGCFGLHPSTPFSQPAGGGHAEGGEDRLSSLPYEVLCHMASFLDSQSLSQLALVSRLMRQVCSSLLQDRGMVTLRWERTSSSHGRAKWRVTHRVWQFSSLFSPVDAWSFRDVPSISEHLKVCPYNEVESKTEKIRLPLVREEIKPKKSCKGPTLVTLFQEKRIMM
ncbi:F-box only protein 40-like [Poecilia latipinna]|uniref:F-box only protein 40-like n=1 Tax=Poecilia latipinna TaxID=48699 RepID=UPI00072DFB52|nr:PREDICTED: F-box only protein 40-like [Poecilia latipinna]XP_014892137.1 PREDICTED: F-box only protein 40-like [Poecilia latipinna]